MERELKISDVTLKRMDLFSEGVVLDETDHLLRRFGRCELVQLYGDLQAVEFCRVVADEYWAIFNGGATFTLEDTREDSPSSGEKDSFHLGADQQIGVLVPFGVSCRVEGEASLIRIMTHLPDLEAGDKIRFLR